MSDPNAEFFEAPKEDQQRYIRGMWEVIEKFSEKEDASERERWRMSEIRLKAAIVARATGVMDRNKFSAETSRHMQIFASAIGGVAFSSEPPPGVSPKLPKEIEDWIEAEAVEYRKRQEGKQ